MMDTTTAHDRSATTDVPRDGNAALVIGLMAGYIVVDHMQYLGLASDGALCVLPGATDRADQTIAYLADFPTPGMW